MQSKFAEVALKTREDILFRVLKCKVVPRIMIFRP